MTDEVPEPSRPSEKDQLSARKSSAKYQALTADKVREDPENLTLLSEKEGVTIGCQTEAEDNGNLGGDSEKWKSVAKDKERIILAQLATIEELEVLIVELKAPKILLATLPLETLVEGEEEEEVKDEEEEESEEEEEDETDAAKLEAEDPAIQVRAKGGRRNGKVVRSRPKTVGDTAKNKDQQTILDLRSKLKSTEEQLVKMVAEADATATIVAALKDGDKKLGTTALLTSSDRTSDEVAEEAAAEPDTVALEEKHSKIRSLLDVHTHARTHTHTHTHIHIHTHSHTHTHTHTHTAKSKIERFCFSPRLQKNESENWKQPWRRERRLHR
jgi:hypothetical protein